MTDHTELRRLAEAATQGEWVQGYEIDGPIGFTRIKASGRALASTAPQCGRPHWNDEAEANAAYIAAASPSVVLSLIAEVERLRTALEPFATAAKVVDQYYGDSTGWQEELDGTEKVETLVLGDFIDVCTIGDLRRARTALGDTNV